MARASPHTAQHPYSLASNIPCKSSIQYYTTPRCCILSWQTKTGLQLQDCCLLAAGDTASPSPASWHNSGQLHAAARACLATQLPPSCQRGMSPTCIAYTLSPPLCCCSATYPASAMQLLLQQATGSCTFPQQCIILIFLLLLWTLSIRVKCQGPVGKGNTKWWCVQCRVKCGSCCSTAASTVRASIHSWAKLVSSGRPACFVSTFQG